MTPVGLSSEEAVERNLATVDAHFHNENPQDIDKAIDLYVDSIVWEVPARGVLLRDKAAAREAYLNIFKSYNIHSMTPVCRFGSGNFVVDDSIAVMTLVGDVEKNVPGCPFPPGTEVSMRIVHIFELDDAGGSSVRTVTSCGGGRTPRWTTTFPRGPRRSISTDPRCAIGPDV